MFASVYVVAVELAGVASEVKAADIKVLFVKPLVYWTRFFIIATAFSRPQIDAIGYALCCRVSYNLLTLLEFFSLKWCLFCFCFILRSKIRDLAEKKYGKVPSGDLKPNSWTLLDFGKWFCIYTRITCKYQFFNHILIN